MINLAVDPRFLQDLEDDFVMNEDLDLYQFIDNDPVTAFYLGYNILKWYNKISAQQKYLYSKQARHNNDALDKYQKQIKFWTDKFPSESDDIDLVKLAEFILNNMFWEESSEDLDRIKMAFFFGDLISRKCADGN